jgi:hypothetical protein
VKAIIRGESGREVEAPISNYMAELLTAFARGDDDRVNELLALRQRRDRCNAWCGGHASHETCARVHPTGHTCVGTESEGSR